MRSLYNTSVIIRVHRMVRLLSYEAKKDLCLQPRVSPRLGKAVLFLHKIPVATGFKAS